jgi:AhpD family alkylhydroperoxidase
LPRLNSTVTIRAAHLTIDIKEREMPEPRIATVRPVAEHEATGKVAEIYRDIKATKNIDFVPNMWRVLATNADHLELVWTRLKSLMHPEAAGRKSPLDPTTREIIALAVSATNGCSYCVNSHTAALRKLGVTPDTLGEVLAIVGLFNTTNSLADGYQVEPDVLPPIE